MSSEGSENTKRPWCKLIAAARSQRLGFGRQRVATHANKSRPARTRIEWARAPGQPLKFIPFTHLNHRPARAAMINHARRRGCRRGQEVALLFHGLLPRGDVLASRPAGRQTKLVFATNCRPAVAAASDESHRRPHHQWQPWIGLISHTRAPTAELTLRLQIQSP